MIASNVNLAERLQTGADHIDGTIQSYAVYLRKYAAFVSAEPFVINGPMIANEFFTDENMAKFIIAIGDEHDHKPHVLKTASAALGYGLKINKRECLNKFKHLYSDTHRAIEVINQ